jgi:hypothetical protein
MVIPQPLAQDIAALAATTAYQQPPNHDIM